MKADANLDYNTNIIPNLKANKDFFKKKNLQDLHQNTPTDPHAHTKRESKIEIQKQQNEQMESRIKKQKMDFFKLLTTQLAKQDPTQPLDVNQMTHNIFSINMVEQQMNANKALQNMINTMEMNRMFDSANYIGKEAIFHSNEIQIQDQQTELQFSIEGKPQKVLIDILNAETLHRVNDKDIEIQAHEGENIHQLTLDRQLMIGRNTVKDGTYIYKIRAFADVDKTQPLKVLQIGRGKITGVLTEGEAEYNFEVNHQPFSLNKIIKIQEPLAPKAPIETIKQLEALVPNAVEVTDAEVAGKIANDIAQNLEVSPDIANLHNNVANTNIENAIKPNNAEGSTYINLNNPKYKINTESLPEGLTEETIKNVFHEFATQIKQK